MKLRRTQSQFLSKFTFGPDFCHSYGKLPSSPRKAATLSLQFLVVVRSGIHFSFFVPRAPAPEDPKYPDVNLVAVQWLRDQQYGTMLQGTHGGANFAAFGFQFEYWRIEWSFTRQGAKCKSKTHNRRSEQSETNRFGHKLTWILNKSSAIHWFVIRKTRFCMQAEVSNGMLMVPDSDNHLLTVDKTSRSTNYGQLRLQRHKNDDGIATEDD